jgi:hypothetical protein
VRPPRPAPAAAGAPGAPSPRITIIALGAALAWAAALPALLEHALPQRPGAPAAADALLRSPAPHTAVAALVLALLLLRQGRWYRPWQSAVLLAVGGLYLIGCAALMAAAAPGGAAPAR